MTLKIWTGADAQTIRKVFQPVIAGAGIKHEVIPFPEDKSLPLTIPSLAPGDVLLACGSKALGALIEAGRFPKKRTVTSCRETTIQHGPGQLLVTHDPGMCNIDWARVPEMQWDAQLAIRLHDTGSVKPQIGKYIWVDSLHEVIEEIDRRYEATGKPVYMACDTETMGLDEYAPGVRILSISFTIDEGKSFMLYFEKGEKPVAPEPWKSEDEMDYWEGLWNQINWLLTTEKVKTEGANWKYDSRWLNHHWAINCTNHKFDTLLVGSLLDENRSNSLKLHAKIMTPLGGYEDGMDNYDMGHLEDVSKEELGDYMGGDTDATHRSAAVMRKELLRDKQLVNFYTKLLHPSAKVFEKMERTGICVDAKYYDWLETKIEAEQERLKAQMKALCPKKLIAKYSDDFSFSRPVIIKDLFFGPIGYNLKPKMMTEKSGQASTSIDHLLMFGDDPEAAAFVKLLSQLNSANKTMSTYVRGFRKHLRSDGRFHPHYMLFKGDYNDDADSGTDTGRTSLKDPAAQCMVGETQVLTNQGIRRLDWLVERHGAGLKVLTHTGRWRKIVGVYRNGVKPVYEVTTGTGHAITCTGNHPILTQRGWVRTDQLQRGDTCFVLRPSNQKLHLPDLLQLGSDEKQVPVPDLERLACLRWEGNQGLRTLVGLRQLPQGYGRETGQGLVHRAGEGGRQLRAGELQVGDCEAAMQQPQEHQADYLRWADENGSGVGTSGGNFPWPTALPIVPWVADDGSIDEDQAAHAPTFQEVSITHVQLIGQRETFDLTIDKSHSFVANGVAVHNTIPKHTIWTKWLRRAFVAPPGHTILQLDFSQGELKIAACLANEPTMIDAYRSGMDLHAITAARISGYEFHDFMLLPEDVRDDLRSRGKAGNFGLLYGMGAEGFQSYAFNSYGVSMTIGECEAAREGFFDLYNRLPVWHESSIKLARAQGAIRSPLGRIRHLPLIHSRDRQAASKAGRNAINSPVQATLSDMMQYAMVLMDREYPDLQMFLMTHDSIGIYVPTDEATIWAKRLKVILENLPLKKEFGWDHQLAFTSDAEVAQVPAFEEEDLLELNDGVRSLATLKKVKVLA